MVSIETINQESVLTLRSNRSATAQETFLFLVVLCSLVMIIGVFWFIAGAWAVLPCAGIELVIVIWLMRRISEETRRHQVIHIRDDEIEIEEGKRNIEQIYRLKRENATCQSIRRYQEHHLMLGDHHITLELGPFLNDENKEKLLKQLMRMGIRIERVNRVSIVVA